MPPGAGSDTSAGVSSSPITRRQDATAFCASVSTWVAIWTGPTTSDTRNANATTVPMLICPATPSHTPTTTTPALARPPAMPAEANVIATRRCASTCRR